MLTPKELKITEFSKSLRGYNPQEVDAQIEYLKKNYTELYERLQKSEESNLELRRMYKEAIKDKDAVRNDLLDAKIASEQIIADAKEKADIVVQATKRNCDFIINDFRRAVEEERNKLLAIQARIQSLKDTLLGECRDYMDAIDNLTEIADTTLYYQSNEELVARAIDEVKTDVKYAMVEKQQLDTISDEDAKVDLECFSEVPIEDDDDDEDADVKIAPSHKKLNTEQQMARTVMIPDEEKSTIGDKYMEFLNELSKDKSDTDKE
ncbi:MAG: DivIVA domain-containing protein [Ruminococcaceae bacterium]|nr:DivIVA domain-containing protein [Oscillospiraceae bacterium]